MVLGAKSLMRGKKQRRKERLADTAMTMDWRLQEWGGRTGSRWIQTKCNTVHRTEMRRIEKKRRRRGGRVVLVLKEGRVDLKVEVRKVLRSLKQRRQTT